MKIRFSALLLLASSLLASSVDANDDLWSPSPFTAPEKGDSDADLLLKQGAFSLMLTQVQVEEFRIASRRWPNRQESEHLVPNSLRQGYKVIIGKNGLVTVTFSGPLVPRRSKIISTPSQVSEFATTWSCKSVGVDNSYFPSRCNK